jgi:hypothetical protein
MISHSEKEKYKNILKPLMDQIGFIEKKKNEIFTINEYSLQLHKEKIMGEYVIRYCLFHKKENKYLLLIKTYCIDTFISFIKNDMNIYIRKYKINKLLNY